MANLWYSLNGVKLFPAIEGLDDEIEPIRDTLDMGSGQRRHYSRPKPSRRRWVLPLPGASEAERATWIGAVSLTSSNTLVTPAGETYTVIVLRFRSPITNSTPDVNGSPNATGPVEYDLELELEEL